MSLVATTGSRARIQHFLWRLCPCRQLIPLALHRLNVELDTCGDELAHLHEFRTENH